MSQINSTDAFTIKVGNNGSMSITQPADLILENQERKSKGRALVCGNGNQLVVNFASDFTAGVLIQGQVRLSDLKAPPAGVETDRVVVDGDGNLYKQD